MWTRTQISSPAGQRLARTDAADLAAARGAEHATRGMADVDAVTEPMSRSAAVDHFGAWARWWLAGTAADWGYVALSAGLIAGGYFDAWINRHLLVRTWEHALPQAAWAAITIYLGVWAFVSFRRDHDLRTAVPEGYGLAVVGCEGRAHGRAHRCPIGCSPAGRCDVLLSVR